MQRKLVPLRWLVSDTCDLRSGILATVSHSSIPLLIQTCLMVADVSGNLQCGLGTGGQPCFWVSQSDIFQQQEICVASRDCQCPELMLSGPEDHVLRSHPLCGPHWVLFLLKLTPGRDHSELERFQSRNVQYAFWYSPLLCAGECQGCVLVLHLSAEGFAGGGVSAFRICLDSSVPTNQKNSRKMCENSPYVYVVRALRD